ncbi:hypothetical protein EHS39_30755 [Ensifer sp. MPMI2T]|nr:hypothetical protein EHS39_30755 [Ensifer sp. MPMI2T]
MEGLFRDFSFARREADAETLANQFPRYNGAPTKFYRIIIRDVIRDPDMFGPTFVSARWGLIPRWIKERRPSRPPPINARCEGISTSGMFKDAYRRGRCLVPVDGLLIGCGAGPGVPVDTLCDLIGPKGEHHSNPPCRTRGSTIPSTPKATSTLKSVNGSIAPPCRS